VDEEGLRQNHPPRKRYRFYKYLTVILFFIVIFFSLGLVGVETTSSSEFCSSCHEMKPEFYTWKASTHSEVDCVNCHTGPGIENYSKSKANGLLQVIKKTTNTYSAPIQMPNEISDASCEKCHNMKVREVSASGDIIIPHDKHMDKDVECIQCHSGVAHGKIADRKVTFKSDYKKWDTSLGKSMMSEKKYTSPKMEECMDCHIARNVTTECSACHTSKMYPESHKEGDFKLQSHGSFAKEELQECNDCHKYMSSKEITLFNNQPAYTQYLRNQKIQSKQVSSKDYAKENTFCKDCHRQRPASHEKGFVGKHGTLASKNEDACLTCHDLQKTGQNKSSNVTCNSCHPSSHEDNREWRLTHPVQVANGVKVNETCYKCHNEEKCQSCHIKE
jgi:nitrate/TMAO reductase-like tetraheme cytochrome c subunit